MRVLVTNDDGIHAPGLSVLSDIAHAISDDVWIVAPESEQSGASHSLTLHVPLRMRQVEERKFAVLGTPTDCVLMGVIEILKDRRPDLVLSGVNRGANVADDVTYSGTVAGAMEGTALGIPSVALSQAHIAGNVPWDTARRFGAPLLRHLLKAGWSREVLLNVNFPPVPPADVRGVRAGVQGTRDQSGIKIERRTDMRNNSYYWIGYWRDDPAAAAGSDISALETGYISVTALHLDLTHHGAQKALDEVVASCAISDGTFSVSG